MAGTLVQTVAPWVERLVERMGHHVVGERVVRKVETLGNGIGSGYVIHE
jgi:hypothetical protein